LPIWILKSVPETGISMIDPEGGAKGIPVPPPAGVDPDRVIEIGSVFTRPS
jgi:hypothetical protein